MLLVLSWRSNSTNVYVAIIAISILGLVSTYFGHGPFINDDLNTNLIRLQLFLASLFITGLTIESIKFTHKLKVPSLLMILTWAITTLLISLFEQAEYRRQKLQFDHHVNLAIGDIYERLNLYENALLAVRAFIQASEKITPQEWEQFEKSFDFINRYPGLIGIGLIERVAPKKLADFIKQQKKMGRSDFAIKLMPFNRVANYPNGFDDRYIMTYINSSPVTTPLIGSDLGSEIRRREALELAISTGKPTATKPVKMLTSPIRQGFLFLLPIFDKSTSPKTSVDRKREVRGFVYAPIVFENFFENAFNLDHDQLNVEISSDQEILYRDGKVLRDQDDFTSQSTISFAQQKLILRWRGTFHHSSSSLASWVNLVASFFTLLLSSLTVGLQNITRKAEEIAEEKTLLLTKSEKEVRQLNQDLEKTVSERTRELEDAFKELQQNEQRLKELADSMPQIVWITDPNGDIEYYNRRWYEYIGEYLSQKELFQYIHPDDRNDVKEKWEKSIAEGMSFEIELRIWSQVANQFCWHLLRIVPIRNKAGIVMRWYGTATDIHDQKQLLLEQQKLISLIENTPDASIMFDGHWEIVYSNSAAQKLFGLERNLSHQITDIFSSYHMFTEIIFPAISQEGKWEGEIELWDKKNQHGIITYSQCFIISDPNGGIPLVTALVSRDISDLKSAELERIEAKSREEAARAASKLKSDFLANLSHEIRTPVNGIIGMTELIRDTDLDPDLQDMVDSLKYSGDSLLALLNDILDFSKIEAGKFELENIPFNLRKLIEETLRTFDHNVIQSKIHLSLEIAPNIPGFLFGDPLRIRQILLNLISNAFKFSQKGDINVKVSQLSLVDKTIHLYFEVTDTGIGISKENISKLFVPFVQADSSMARRFGGAGLGLSICKYLVEKMNGNIGVTSQIGIGSTFWFDIALQTQVPAVIPEENGVKQISQKINILVAEDNNINQKVFGRMLEKINADVSQVFNGKEAVNLCEKQKFDVILMDCQMPVMDGYSATKTIRDSHGINAFTPIIAVTANAGKDEYQRCINAGMNDCIYKPMKTEILLNTITTWVERNSPSLDRSQLLHHVDQTGEMFEELKKIYQESTPRQIREIAQALESKDYGSAAFLVHRLKSGALNLGYQTAGRLCEFLEQELLSGNNPDVIESKWIKLKEELQATLRT